MTLFAELDTKNLFRKAGFLEGEAPAEPIFLASDGSAGASPTDLWNRLLTHRRGTPSAVALRLCPIPHFCLHRQ
jgi:hypothetical protein